MRYPSESIDWSLDGISGYRIFQSWSFVGKVLPDFVAIRVLSISKPRIFEEGVLEKLKYINWPVSDQDDSGSAIAEPRVRLEGSSSGLTDDFCADLLFIFFI